MKFRATILASGKTATGIQVPPEVVEGLGSSKHPAVVVTIGSYAYRSSVAVMGGVYMLPISVEHRAGAGVVAGDEVEVDLELDTQPREVTIPADFANALGQDLVTKQRFDGLSYSQKLRHVLAIEEAKTADTRQHRIAKAIEALRTGTT
jgi:hypothetical protein